MNHKKLAILACVMALMVSLSACGSKKTQTPAASASPTPTAETTVIPTTTPGSVNEHDENTGDITDPANSVDPGDENRPDSAREENHSAYDSAHENGSTAGEDLKRAGEDMGSAVGEVGRSIEDAMDSNHNSEQNNGR